MISKNILITGGAGFIGSNLASNLVDRRYDVTVMDNLSPQIHGQESMLLKNIEGRVKFIRGDVRSRDDWLLALKNQDAVIHLAAETGTGQSMYEIERYMDVNVRGTSIFLDILANTKHNIKKVIVASSRAIYGEGKYSCEEHGIVYPLSRKEEDMQRGDFAVKCPKCNNDVVILPTDEDSCIHPTSIYGISKQIQEQLVLTVGKSLGVPSIAFRYQNVYGPGQSLLNPYTGILSIFSTRIKNRNDILIFEDGLESRDFVYIDDVVNATVDGLEKFEMGCQAFNVGSGYQTSVLKVAQALINGFDSEVKTHITGNFRVGDIRNNYADLSKLAMLLNSQPNFEKFENGIKKFISWVNLQKIPKDEYENSISEMKSRGLYK
jgi:dTDP-L-rhamnose 4-epimerase